MHAVGFALMRAYMGQKSRSPSFGVNCQSRPGEQIATTGALRCLKDGNGTLWAINLIPVSEEANNSPALRVARETQRHFLSC
ncbi:hypothetical protein HYFRA_00009180 [Hymenoscyphus fraxineus]|uniref:Uncharacterized protein n=1 Tax=Hymenoscyphus fraxineus TaxID=746836 RepID=A0A9N9KWE2_9HELO|nr:hypothetical protein HYFRA_00009180 [Hymenoscyphus fraxineus]